MVTGASGGIGSAIARKFAEEGARLILHYYSNHKAIESLQRDLKGVETMAIRGDLARESDVRRLFKKAVARFGHVDTLVANAGYWEMESVPLHLKTLNEWRSTLDGILTSVFLTTREHLLHVAKRKRGNLVLIGSTAAVFGEAGHADYAAGKAAVAFGLTRTLKNELSRLAPHTKTYCGGRVNCVCPGWTVVPRNEKRLKDFAMARRVTATMALPQIGRPDDMAHMVVFLASDHLARHITGQTVVIAGGMEGRLLWQPAEIDATAV